MTFRVFISASMEDIHIVNELIEIFKRHGIDIVLPQETMLTEPITVTDMTKKQIRTSDCVLAIMGRGGSWSADVAFEIGMAAALGKLVIPIVEEGTEIPASLRQTECIIVDKNQPKLSYERAARYLDKLKIEKERRNAVGGLVLLGLGLLLLDALASGN